MEMAKKSKLNENLEVAKNMPKLYHTLPGEEYDIIKSEVVNWLIRQPEIRQYIFQMVINHQPNKRPIKYDPISKKWMGVNYGK